MKRILLIFLCIPSFFTCSSQSTITYNILNYYNGDSSTNSSSIRTLTKLDTNYIITITGSTDSVYYKLVVAKIDKYGDIIKSIDFGIDSVAIPIYPGNTIIKDRDSNIVVTANYWYYNYNGDWDGYIIKLDKNLDTIWTLKDALPDTLAGCPPDTNVVNYLTAIKQTPDGGYIATGNYTMNCTAGNQRAYLLKLDTAGNVEWRKVYQNLTEIYDIEIASDSGFYFSLGLNGDVYLYKTDKYGNVEWNVIANSNNITGKPMIVETLDTNHVIVLSAFWYDFANDKRAITVTKINVFTHNVVWEKDYYIFQSVRCPGLHQNMEMKCIPNGNIIICGTAYVVNNDTTMYGYMGTMLKLNSNGDSLWSHYYNYGHFADDCQFNDIVLTDDGGFLAAGYHFPYDGSYNSGAWLVKMDSLGNAPGCFTQDIREISENTFSFNIFPNPANEHITIKINNWQPDKSGRFDIYNMDMKLLHSEAVSNKTSEISIKDIEQGAYIVRLVQDNKVKASEKLVIIR